MIHNNQPIITAITSYGASSEVFHCPTLNYHRGFQIKTILERNGNRCLEKYPDTLVVKSFEEILSDPEIELVIVNTPNEFHFPMAKAALLAGKHVIVEKPFTIISRDGEELIDLAKKQGKILSVFHSKRYETDFLTVESVLKDNLVGTPIELHWHYDRYRPGITHKLWKEKDFPGAGVLYDLGAHTIDSTVQLFGLPKTITCHLRILREEAGSPDYFHVHLGYENMDVFLHSSTLVMERGPHIALHGTKGSYIKYSNDPQEEQLKQGLLPGDIKYGKDTNENYGILTREVNNTIVSEKYTSKDGSYVKYYDGMFNAIRNSRPLPVMPEQALNNIRIIEYAMQSHKEGRTINYE